MLKLKTSEISSKALDFLVAKILLPYRVDDKYGHMFFRPQVGEYTSYDNHPLPYSTEWKYGGPIIDQEKLSIAPVLVNGDWFGDWRAVCLNWDGCNYAELTGPTALIAAMRCYVASRLGEAVYVPEEFQ